MPGYTEQDLDTLFTYHKPKDDQAERYLNIRAAAHVLARTILENAPGSPDQTVAIRKVREAVYQANAAIALEGKY